ncbi:MAG: hypothetical protein ACI906_005086 [Candidatus Latescibacterota bacterium]|jgi:hypothetical protein
MITATLSPTHTFPQISQWTRNILETKVRSTLKAAYRFFLMWYL